jgi:hypothetical protein
MSKQRDQSRRAFLLGTASAVALGEVAYAVEQPAPSQPMTLLGYDVSFDPVTDVPNAVIGLLPKPGDFIEISMHPDGQIKFETQYKEGPPQPLGGDELWQTWRPIGHKITFELLGKAYEIDTDPAIVGVDENTYRFKVNSVKEVSAK